MSAEEVATEIFGGAVTPEWVGAHVAPRIKLGRAVLWYEEDARAWMEREQRIGRGEISSGYADLMAVADGRGEANFTTLSEHVRALKTYAKALKERIDAMAAQATVSPATEREVLADARLIRSVIYGLVDPRTPDRFRYIGQTRNPSTRYVGHLTSASAPLTAWFHEMACEGIWPTMLLVEDAASEDLNDREVYWIHHYRGMGMADLNTTTTRSRRW